MTKVLLFIPPLTQLNTPYPATAYLTGFLKDQGVECNQADIGLDMVLEVFCKEGLATLFDAIEAGEYTLHHSLQNIVLHRKKYEQTIDEVISFLQNKNYTVGYRIAQRNYLPEGKRFLHIKNLDWFFGNIGTHDKARYLCTMYLEDLSDLIQATVGPHFGFSKYAERVARTAVSFDPIEEALIAPTHYLDQVLLNVTARYFEKEVPDIVGFTVPFGGNLYGALKVGQWIKAHFPKVKILLGGGYANTELRELSDPRVFNYVDFITLDDGEGPLLHLIKHIHDDFSSLPLKRTYLLHKGKVDYRNNLIGGDFGHGLLPAPSYVGLRLPDYLSMFDVPNPMHRLWNDGRWNKLTVAHGCYWKKCSFCDISLDYIQRYENTPVVALVDKMEKLIAETGETGFHFVDEAAPPLALRDLALEILKRNLQVTWWTNIRFEKTFSEDLCKLLAASGCIAVTGGLEVASQRLLDKMEKGITIEQVARVCRGFREAGILVHAYLMYGFPTETAQETIDSLEIVRQLFDSRLLQSAFWHQFAMTVHSPVGMYPEKYGVIRTGPEFKGFANNDLYHEDPTGADHEKFSDGLKKALYNYMHGNGLEFPLQKFFEFKIPPTTVAPKLIARFVKHPLPDPTSGAGYYLVWNNIAYKKIEPQSNGAAVLFIQPRSSVKIQLPQQVVSFIESYHTRFDLFSENKLPLSEALEILSSSTGLSLDQLLREEWWLKLRKEVLWVLKL